MALNGVAQIARGSAKVVQLSSENGAIFQLWFEREAVKRLVVADYTFWLNVTWRPEYNNSA